MCRYHVDTGVQMLGWIHQDCLRRDGDLTDDDGRVTSVVALLERDM